MSGQSWGATVQATVRRAVFCVIGALLLSAYLVLWTGFAQMLGDSSIPGAGVWVLIVLTAAIALTPPFLAGVRTLEIQAARSLLDADLPAPVAEPDASSRWGGALWYALHLGVGGAATLSLLTAAPVAVVLLLRPAGDPAVLGSLVGFLADVPAGVAVLLGLLLLAVPPAVFHGAGALLRVLAPRLLGPTTAERIAELERQRRDLAARNRLARDLHDSVGHALTVTTLQAAAGGRALDRDPELARAALRAIEDVGRAAVEDLDRVLGLLREGDAAGVEERLPARLLPQVAELVRHARETGRAVDLALPEATDDLPAVVSREAYAVVREAVTNALRHGQDPTAVRVTRESDAVRVEVTNATAAPAPPRRGGRGLAGLAERVELLGGTLVAGPVAGGWRVVAELPVTTGEDRWTR